MLDTITLLSKLVKYVVSTFVCWFVLVFVCFFFCRHLLTMLPWLA